MFGIKVTVKCGFVVESQLAAPTEFETSAQYTGSVDTEVGNRMNGSVSDKFRKNAACALTAVSSCAALEVTAVQGALCSLLADRVTQSG